MEDKQAELDALNIRAKNTLMAVLSIEFIDIGEDYLVAKMPVNAIVHQPIGILHGGASAVLGESVASSLSNWVVKPLGKIAVGVNIQANHLRSIRSGEVTCKAVLKRKGRTMHYTEMEVRDENQRLICAMSMNNMVLNGPPKTADSLNIPVE
ncbi:PaaI family thioesterase [Stenoxybacter acetivorans]|uniref:PaaI family thioesterase n=1 Tax=Stenoxybacter acetivorans TaxID=422441 RepID=UPI00069122D5|nr:PaaI family thioesterase [Stenoxybacter acetivorans]